MHQNKPIIYTSKGNMFVDELDYQTQWTDTEDYIKFEEIYRHNDEIVKSNCHVYSKKPLEFTGLSQSF